MNRQKIARELVGLAKELTALRFNKNESLQDAILRLTVKPKTSKQLRSMIQRMGLWDGEETWSRTIDWLYHKNVLEYVTDKPGSDRGYYIRKDKMKGLITPQEAVKVLLGWFKRSESIGIQKVTAKGDKVFIDYDLEGIFTGSVVIDVDVNPEGGVVLNSDVDISGYLEGSGIDVSDLVSIFEMYNDDFLNKRSLDDELDRYYYYRLSEFAEEVKREMGLEED